MFYQKKATRKGPYFKSLANSSYGENRSTNGGFSTQELFDFFNGEWVTCRSTNVKRATYVEDDQTLFVEFLSGDTYQYFGIDDAMAESFAASPTKGGWIWDQRRAGGLTSYYRVG